MKTFLTNGLIVDGSGCSAFPGSVVLDGDTIASVIPGDVSANLDGTVIDCTGKVIAPGFIDAHSHNDWFAARETPLPYFRPFVEQGITSQVTGNCGFSPFGYERDTPHALLINKNLFERGDAPGDFSTFAGWKVEAEKRTPLNLIPIQGHGAIRAGLAGYQNRPLSRDELSRRNAKLKESFDQGAFGVSFGLMYEPDRYASAAELEEAARITAGRGGVLTVHERACSAVSTSYSPPVGGRPHNLRALEEMIKLAEKTDVRLQYSHLIFVGESSWKTVDACLTMIDEARARGIDIAFDLYSMTFGVSVITVVLPSWYLSLPAEKKSRWSTRKRLAAEIGLTKKLLGFGFEDMLVAWIGEGHEDICGKRIPQIAAEWGNSELDAYLRLVDLSGGTGRLNLYKYYSEDIISTLIRHEGSLFMTDAWIEDTGVQNAAAYGSFPKFLQLSHDGKGIALEKTVRKMTGAVADRFGISDRGYLREGAAADITVFDFARVAAKGDEPTRPEGIIHVFVNGIHVVSNGIAIDASLLGAGQILTK